MKSCFKYFLDIDINKKSIVRYKTTTKRMLKSIILYYKLFNKSESFNISIVTKKIQFMSTKMRIARSASDNCILFLLIFF